MIQVIEVQTNKLITQEKIENIKFLPRIDEIMPLKDGIFQVKGIAHMWDAGLIKIMVSRVNQ